ncbi:MAG: PTS sugar transporter subunit IIB [Myxococcota bacterium]|nr:PTS sugar transporter subunit IIB [Myxococcota bacterium]
MSIFYRIDNRLVHGQIISTWMPHLRVRHFVIANDAVPKNALQMTMFRMAIPAEHGFTALSIKDAARFLNDNRNSTESILVLLESVSDAQALFEAGHPFPQLNIGNIHHAAGKAQITNAVYLDENEQTELKSLLSRGLRINIQTLPSETPTDLRRVLEAQ